MISLSNDPSDAPYYMQIYQQYKEAIHAGILKANEKMPSKRKLATELGVSVTTVDAAYQQLVSEGFVQSFPKKGYFVCRMEELAKSQPKIPERENRWRESRQVLVDFSTGDIDTEHFPYNTWRRLMKNAFNEYDADLLKRTPAQGNEALRRSIARYLYESRGVNCTAGQIVIGAGTDNLLQVLSYILDNACTIAMENPVYNKAYQMFSRMGHAVLPVDIDEDGMPVEPLEGRENIAVYITPSHQFPLGISMPISRRVRLLNWAEAGRGRYIIEDDYDSEFRYHTKPLPSLQSIDTHEKVIYLGTFTKSIAPTLRISYMVLPAALFELYRREYGFFGSPVSGLEQKVLHEFIEQGYFERHLNKMRVLYKYKRMQLVNALRIFGNAIQVSGENAGHHLLVRLKTGTPEQAMCEAALDNGVKVYPISRYFVGKMPERYQGNVLMGYGALSEKQIQEGVALLKKAWIK